jgi:hypothetical protein
MAQNSQRDRWREPLLDVHTEEAYTLDADGNRRRGIKHIVTGPDRFDNVGRMLSGLACSNCLTPFPDRPGLHSISAFKQLNYQGLRTEEEALALVARGCCPICGHEVSLEMGEVQFLGTQEYSGDIRKHDI